MKYLRAIAGCFAGAGALLLIYQQRYDLAGTLLGTMLGFFVGEANGQRMAET
jgi:hypothetical protein